MKSICVDNRFGMILNLYISKCILSVNGGNVSCIFIYFSELFLSLFFFCYSIFYLLHSSFFLFYIFFLFFLYFFLFPYYQGEKLSKYEFTKTISYIFSFFLSFFFFFLFFFIFQLTSPVYVVKCFGNYFYVLSEL